MIRTLSLISLCVLAGTVHATSIASYVSRADVAADGGAKVVVTLKLEEAGAGPLALPVGFGSVDALTVVNVPAGVTIAAPAGKRKTIDIALPAGIAGDATLKFAFETQALMAKPKVEEGKKPELATDSQLIKHRFINTQAATIGDYRVEVILPHGIQVQEVREQTPKPKRSDILPRVQLGAHEGRQSALLQLAEVKQGDRTSMELEAVSAQRSIGWLLAGLALCGFYLINFKDLVTRKSE